MTKPSFTLLTGIGGPMQDGPEPEVVRVPLRGHSTKTIKKKAPVGPGTLVADHPDPAVGDAHSPILGVVADVTDTEVVINAGEAKPAKEGEAPPKADPVAPVDVASLATEDLRKALKTLGVSTKPFAKAATLIVNGLNPEPGVGIAEILLKEHQATVEKGLQAVQKLVEPPTVLLAAPAGSPATLFGCTVKQVAAAYPNSLNPLVIKALTGKESSDGVTVVSVMELYAVGRVVETGLPLTETVLTVGNAAYRVKVGTPIAAVLAKAGVTPAPGDRVVVGGPLRGKTVASVDAGVSKDDYALLTVPLAAYPPVTDLPCINCGECALVCPSRIMPGFVTRYVEFKIYDKAKEFHLEACMECGLCGYVCTARRPLMQFIRLGKKTLDIQASALTSCRLQGE
ncbi:MAG: 4Fe-4S dicluster domain-containing protein [Thermodesulfobacteriota bacterium]